MTAATKRGLEMEIVSNSSILPRLVLISHGSSLEGNRIRGKSKNRLALTGLEPTTACTKYCSVNASPKVTRIPYSTGRSMRPSYIGVRKSRSNAAPRMRVPTQAARIPRMGEIPGNQTAVT